MLHLFLHLECPIPIHTLCRVFLPSPDLPLPLPLPPPHPHTHTHTRCARTHASMQSDSLNGICSSLLRGTAFVFRWWCVAVLRWWRDLYVINSVKNDSIKILVYMCDTSSSPSTRHPKSLDLGQDRTQRRSASHHSLPSSWDAYRKDQWAWFLVTT